MWYNRVKTKGLSMNDLLGQPIRNGQRCVFVKNDDYKSGYIGRKGTVERVTDIDFYVIFDTKPGNVRGSRMSDSAPVIVNIDAIADKYPENFL